MNWTRTIYELPPENVVVETKIDDGHGLRNECDLKLHNGLWWFADMTMYIYYNLTHWRFKGSER